MRNLFVNKLKYAIDCEDESKYGASVEFHKGLNIIYGPNSVGKSSVIIGIIYALGLEKSLGIFSSKQNPFKPEFYDKIENKKIVNSTVFLEVSNGSQTITLSRPIIGKTEICTLKECTLNNFEKEKKQSDLIADGSGVMSEDGLQRYLFNFFNWDILEVPTFEGGSSKIYLENLVPLFYIEQRVGWSQIQARQVTRYGIKDIKKIAFEYLMGLDKFNVHLVELEQKALRQSITDAETDLKNKEENILVLGNASKDQDGGLIVNDSHQGQVNIDKLILLLEEEINAKNKEISSLSKKEEKTKSFEVKERDKLREISNSRRVAADKVNLLIREIASYENYIHTIEINREKNIQLKKIEELGTSLNVAACPICETPLSSSDEGCCRLCKENIQKISTPEENISFLEDEKASFSKILVQKQIELKKARQYFTDLSQEERELIEKLNFQLQTYYGEDLQQIRKITTEADLIMNALQKYKGILLQWKGLSKIRDEIKKLIVKEKEKKDQIRQYEKSVSDETILNKLLEEFKENILKMRLFSDKRALVKDIRLNDFENYTPYLDNFDIYNISSSSDNIRIILSYYLALLQTAANINDKKIRYPCFLLIDEPKQQNLDEEDLYTSIDLVTKLDKNKSQVILTTHVKEKKKVEPYIVQEMTSKSDYLLKRIN